MLLTNAYAVALVAFGIGFVIFVHELGHFLAAKWAGVKVEKFAIGFGPVLFSFRKGIGFRLGSTMKEFAAALETPDGAATVSETEYSLRALPLGGYVLMLGEDPGGDSTKTADPRAFSNRPVGARMVIISAGVVMNLIFGFFCYVGMHLLGVEDIAAVLGTIVPDQPAYEAGFQPGDTILAIDGHPDVTYNDLRQAVALSGTGQKVKFDVKHPGGDRVVTIEVEPMRAAKAMTPTIGVLSSASLTLAQDPKIPGDLGSTETTNAAVKAVGPQGEPAQPVATFRDLARAMVKAGDRPVTVVVERGPLFGKKGETTREEATIPPQTFRDLGLVLTPGAVVAIRPGSPAAVAGFRKGDQIVSVEGDKAFNPMRLPDLIAARAGKPTAFEVRRPGESKDGETVALTATPDDSPPWVDLAGETSPLDLPGLGLAIPILPKVAAVVPGSPASKARIQPGDVLTGIRFSSPVKSKDDGKKAATPESKFDKEPVPLGAKGAAWPAIFARLQDVDGPVRLGIEGTARREIELTPAPVPGWNDPMRGLGFQALTIRLPPQPLGESIRRGARDTRETTLSFYVTLRSLFQRRLSPKAFISPLEIGRIAFSVAKYSEFSNFARFIAMISINLAVVNFLPIPPLDGGRMMFLIAEKVRGRPLPDDAVFWPTMIGIAFVLILFAAVLIKDLWSYF